VSGRTQGKQRDVAGGTGVRGWLLSWALLFVLWLAVVGSVAISEIVAGVAAAAVASTAVEVVRRQHIAPFRPDPRWVFRLRTVPWRTVREFALLTWALVRAIFGRRVVGRFLALDVEVGGEDGRSSARRALLTAGASISPNAYVVDFDHEGDRVIVHQLVAPYAKRVEDVVP
jgi:multisubunit Na+/H+ antiporter MnhE subunit